LVGSAPREFDVLDQMDVEVVERRRFAAFDLEHPKFDLHCIVELKRRLFWSFVRICTENREIWQY